MRTRIFLSLGVAASAALAACGGSAPATGGEVNVYSHRHYESDEALFRRFTEETGIKVNVVTASADELITRLENEGDASPADMLITVDAGRLHRAREKGLLQPVRSEVLDANVPAALRDPEGYWYGLTKRARVLVYDTSRVRAGEIKGYEDLADARWRGKVLVRSSGNVYNQSLLASLVASMGEEGAERWAAAVVQNMARQPSGADTDQAKAVAAGVGDVAIVNTYYVARLKASEDAEERRIGERLAVIFPEQEGRGTHVNVSGAGITKSSKNRANALKLLEFLSGEEAQRAFTDVVFEYPVNPRVEPAALLKAMGEFREDTLNLSRLGELNAPAVKIFDRVGWR
jgi:iron(III) transport system substrate-binding protein